MASFELVETGLTADKFIIKRTGQSPAAESANPGSPPRIKQVSARNALLSGVTGLAGRLSVRGLNFVNALVEMTGGHAIDVSFLEIHPYQVALEGWRRPDSMLDR